MARIAFFTLLAIIWFLCTNTKAFAGEEQRSVTIDAIEVRGLERTHKDVVLQELSLTLHTPISIAAIEEGIQRLRNLQIFSLVAYDLQDSVDTAGGSLLQVTLSERWTTIPIAKLTEGGGVRQMILGGYDVNVFGRYLELGAQYERLGDENSGVVWFRDPRLFGKRLSLFVNYWNIKRARVLYRQDVGDTVDDGGYLQDRVKLGMTLEKEVFWWLQVGLTAERNVDSFDNALMQTHVDEMLTWRDMPPDTSATLVGPLLKIGRLNYDGYLVDGQLVELAYQAAMPRQGADSDFYQTQINFAVLRTVAGKSTLGLRLAAGKTDTDLIQYQYYLGGLDRIRGFVDSRFYGRNFWLANVEGRTPFYEHPWLVVQGIAFYDTIGLGDEVRDLEAIHAASAGVGVRLISPKVYRLVLRFDYAKTLKKHGDAPLSFGVQQFF